MYAHYEPYDAILLSFSVVQPTSKSTGTGWQLLTVFHLKSGITKARQNGH